jgi:hypothetical protein
LDVILGFIILFVAGVTIALFAYNIARQVWRSIRGIYKFGVRMYCQRYINLAEEIIGKHNIHDPFNVGNLPQALVYYYKVQRILTNFRYRDRVEYLKTLINDSHEFTAAIGNNHSSRSAAKVSISEDLGNPFDLSKLERAISHYQEGINLLNSYHDRAATEEVNRNHHDIAQLELELDRRRQFRDIFDRGERDFQQQYYQLAIDSFLSAQKLYSPTLLEQRIEYCKLAFEREVDYLQQISNIKSLARQGKFDLAKSILDRLLADFPRSDGEELRQKLILAIASSNKFNAGSMAERAGNLDLAKQYYLETIDLTPQLIAPRIRLSLMAIATKDWQMAIDRLADVESTDANYLKGYIYIQQKKWQLARKAWTKIDRAGVKIELEKLKKLAVRDRIDTVDKIRNLVDNEQLESAQSISEEFIGRWGVDPAIQSNLDKHIVPRMTSVAWKAKDWEKLAKSSKLDWLANRDVSSLHNWAVATYYLAQSDEQYLSETIVAWANAIAYLPEDRSIQDLPWLAGNSVAADEFSIILTKILSEQIERVKERDLDRYLSLRDLYRQEIHAFKMYLDRIELYINNERIKISPEGYRRSREIQAIDPQPRHIWKTLYTEWGKAVAACLDGDPLRAIAIKPDRTNSPLEELGSSFVDYSQGCHYLEQHQWRDSISPLSRIAKQLPDHPDWAEKIDELCLKQQQWIDGQQEHLEFAKYWYDLCPSSDAKDYYLEYQVLYIDREWCENRLDDISALRQLEKLKQLDPHRQLTHKIMEKVEAYISNN